MQKHIQPWARLAAAVFIAAVGAAAQTGGTYATRGPADGTTPVPLTPGSPAGAYALSGFENINYYTGHLNVSLPLLELGGRGEVRFRMMAAIDAPKWTIETATRVQDRNGTGAFEYQHTTSAAVEKWQTYQAGYGPGILVLKRVGEAENPCATSDPRYHRTFSYLVFLQPDGSELSLYDRISGGQPAVFDCNNLPYAWNRGAEFAARDGSAATFIATANIYDEPDPNQYPAASESISVSGALYLADGTKYTITNGLVQSIRDRNGNLITFQYQPGTTLVSQIQDAAGRIVTVAYNTRVTATETDDTITFPGAQGQSRTIVVTKMFPRDRLRPDLPQPSSLFPELGTAIVGPGPRIARIRLPDNRTYEFYYTPYGELARVVLPTGGTIDYDHGPGLAGAGSIPGAYASGQVLDSLSPLWTVMTGSVPPPPWQPYVYRRLLERREYPDGVGMPSGLVTSFGRVETATGSFTDPVSGRIQSVSLSTSASAAVTRSGPGLAAPVTEFHYYHGEAYGQPVLSSPPIGPAAGLAYSSPRYSPDPFEGKEYKTETAGLLRVERVYVEGANGAGLLCQENTTWLSNNLTSARYMQYDSQFANLTDVYEYDFGAAPAIQTATNGVRTWLACPSSPPANATRRQHKEYLLSSAYTAAPVHVRRLVTREQVISPQGAVVADTKITYDNQSDADCTLTYSLADVMTTLQRDPAYGASLATRGNPRCVSRWRSSSLGWVTVGMSYDTAGNLLQRRDERGNVTTFSYTDQYDIGSPPASTKSLVTSITNPRGHVTRWWYDYGTGKPTRHEDPNAIQTTYSYADPLDRLTSAARGGYETVSFTYQDAQRLVTTRRDLNAANDQLRLKEAVYDGFGRTILVREHEGGGVWTKVETRYDAMGRVWQVSNPYRSSASAWTVTEYDGLGRTVRVTAPGGAATVTQFTGPNARVIDAAGREKTLLYDGLGRLKQVQEGTTSDMAATYGYDLLDNLTTVSQATQVRTFAYDGIGRLLSAQNPENGTISYTYDAVGNLISKTDARGVVTTMTYDELNRLTSKSYTTQPPVASTPAVSYTYDQNLPIAGVTTENRAMGRLVKVAVEGTGIETVYRWDGLGRPLASQQTTGSGSYVFRYTHMPAGLASTTYPSGRVVTQSYDAAGRVNTVSGMMGSTPTQYVTGASYAAHGAVEQMPLGNTRTEQWCYNDRLQPVAVRLGTGASSGCAMQSGDLLRLGFDYGTTNNNGNVLNQTIARPSFSATQTYTYDAYNRIQNVQEGGNSRDFQYKEPGNMYVPSSQGTGWAPGSFTPTSPTWFDGNNRLVNPLLGIQYDAAGNLTAIGGFTFEYDAENRLTSSTINSVTTTYVYDGEGRRVKKGSVVMVYDAFGRLAAEYGGTADPVGTEYLTADHLGSTRLVTSSTGAERRCLDYLPFGEQMTQGMGTRGSCYASATEPRVKFTGKERDSETGLDYSLARYMSAAQGRFTGADPIFGDRNDPQSWNMYAYARNNPLLYTDPDGMSYRICQLDEEGKETNCTTQRNELTDKQFSAFQKDNKRKMAFVGGKIFAINDDGSRTQTGTYKQTDVDLDTPLAQAAAQGIQNSATVTDPRFIAAFYGASALGGIGLNALGVTGASGFQMTTALGGTTENMVLVSRWGRTGLEAGDWVMKGGKNWINYALSGKWQPGLGNQFARFASGAEYYVPQSTIRLPIFKEMGLGAIKALLGQRLFIP